MPICLRAPRRASLLALLALAGAAPAAGAATTSSLSGEATRVVDGKLFAKAGTKLTSTMHTDVPGAICGWPTRTAGNSLIDFNTDAFGGWSTGPDGRRSNSYSFATHRARSGLLTMLWDIRRWDGDGDCVREEEIVDSSAPQHVFVDGAGPMRRATVTQAGATGRYWFTGPEPVEVAWGEPDDGSGVGVASDHPDPPGATRDAEGWHVLSAKTTDLLGNEATSYAGFGIDRTPPTAGADVSPQPTSAGWHRDTVRVALTAADAEPGAGVYKLRWSIDGGPVQFGYYDDENVVTVSEAGTTRITYYAGDGAGLTSAPKTVEVSIDRTAPTIAATADGAAPSGWHADEATVALRAQDEGGAGVDEILYAVDGGAEQSADGASADVEVTGDGSHTVTYRTVDRAGNASAPQSITVRVDGTDPAAQAAVTPEPVAAGWHADTATVQLTATDAHSGVESIMWAIGERKETVAGDSASVPVTEEGVTEVRYRAKDRAGNIGETQSFTVRIDRTDPQVEATVDPAPVAAGWHADDATVTLRAADAHSGVERITWSLGDGEQQTATGDTARVPVTGEGVTEVRYRATDRVGNVTEERTFAVRIDRTPPEATCAPAPAALWPPDGAMRPVALDVRVTDGLSGPGGFVLTSVTSDEPGGASDIDGFDLGTPDVEGLLRAKRLGSGDGRTYTLVYEARDMVGNASTCTAQVAVEHDRRR